MDVRSLLSKSWMQSEVSDCKTNRVYIAIWTAHIREVQDVTNRKARHFDILLFPLIVFYLCEQSDDP